ncbi:HBL/NHE enterotoxin family protein [Streptomyces sp. NPDC090303]|uniref:HBL/NHE enterotoxin family protein n=1 Tax=Streptomyces sp. NPDC090303 TaxID=3365960 RepID=UPI00380C00B6
MPEPSANNALNPLTLGRDISALASAALVAQGWALVALRQVSGSTYVTDKRLATSVQTGQARGRYNARQYLNVVVPDVIAGILDAESAANFVATLKQVTDVSEEDVATIIDTLIGEFTTYQENAQGLADSLDALVTSVGGDGDTFGSLLQQAMDTVQSTDMSRTLDQLNDAYASLGQDMDDVVQQATDLGDKTSSFLLGKARMATGIYGEYVYDPSAGADQDSMTDDEKAEAAAQAKQRKENSRAFPTQALDFLSPQDELGQISQDTAALDNTVYKYRTAIRRVGQLYTTLALQYAELNVLAAIDGQNGSLTAAVKALSTAAATLAATWKRLLDNITALSGSSGSVDLASLGQASGTRWTSLSATVGQAKSALTDTGSSIPDAGTLAPAGTKPPTPPTPSTHGS